VTAQPEREPVFRWSSPDRRWDGLNWARPTGPVEVPPVLNFLAALSPLLAVLGLYLLFYR
jgi:hypothetical protein